MKEILDLLGPYLDAAVVFVTKFSLLFRLALVILCMLPSLLNLNLFNTSPLLIIFLLQGKSWVDIGCGNGAFTAQIIEKCAPCKVEGIDPSDAQVEGAKKCSWKVPVNFQTGDAMALPYDSDSFDIGK